MLSHILLSRSLPLSLSLSLSLSPSFPLSSPLSTSEYRRVQVKEGSRANMHPQLHVKGVGYDRLLGGFEIDTRLQKHLAKLFKVYSTNNLPESCIILCYFFNNYCMHKCI